MPLKTKAPTQTFSDVPYQIPEMWFEITERRREMEELLLSTLREIGYRFHVSGECWEAEQTFQRGYGWIRLAGNQMPMHRWVWSLFNDELPTGLAVMHRCDNPPCFRPAHLMLGAQAANSRDMQMKGRGRAPGSGLRGAAHPRATAKLNEHQVARILDRHADGVRTYLIAREFGVHPTTVSDITKRGAWGHVPRPEARR